MSARHQRPQSCYLMFLIDDVLERSAILEFDAGVNRPDADRQAFREVMGKKLPYPVDTIIFCASDTSDESIAAARKYLSDNNLTPDDVKFVKRDGMVMLITKKELGA